MGSSGCEAAPSSRTAAVLQKVVTTAIGEKVALESEQFLARRRVAAAVDASVVQVVERISPFISAERLNATKLHLRVAFAISVLGRTGCGDQRVVDHAQHRLDAEGRAARLGPGAVRLNDLNQRDPRHHTLHFFRELPLARVLGRQVQAKSELHHGHRAPLRCLLHACKIRAGNADLPLRNTAHSRWFQPRAIRRHCQATLRSSSTRRSTSSNARRPTAVSTASKRSMPRRLRK